MHKPLLKGVAGGIGISLVLLVGIFGGIASLLYLVVQSTTDVATPSTETVTPPKPELSYVPYVRPAPAPVGKTSVTENAAQQKSDREVSAIREKIIRDREAAKAPDPAQVPIFDLYPELRDPDSELFRRVRELSLAKPEFTHTYDDKLSLVEQAEDELFYKHKAERRAAKQARQTPPAMSPVDPRRLAAAGSTEFAEKKKPVEPEQKPVIVYPTGGGNYRASDGTVILRTGDAVTVYPPK